MGIPSEMRNHWSQTINSNNQRINSSFVIPSPAEDRRILEARRCTQEGARAGAKAAVIAAGVSAVPTLLAVRMVPWAKANLNYTAQALIISSASIASYFITADKTILECARRNAQSKYEKNA
ncbi:early nodulin-93-like [Euphorbia lathyris]|uniref:early nodulin-93-like n=1 Tax=Euphorbia lathyris TaxID=212925 RepID=UPI0033135BA4